MAKSRPTSPGSTITTSSIKSGPGGRKYTTRIEKSKPTYTFRVETKTTTESALPEELELDSKHFTRWPGILKILQLVSIEHYLLRSDAYTSYINQLPLIHRRLATGGGDFVHDFLLSTLDLVYTDTLRCGCDLFRLDHICLPILPVHSAANRIPLMELAQNCKLVNESWTLIQTMKHSINSVLNSSV